MNEDENKKDDLDNADQTGGEDNDTTGDNAGSDNSNDNNSGNKPTEKTFTQRQVSAMMSKEKKQGRDAAYKEMGINPDDKKMVSMFKAFIESQKTDEQKASEAAAEQAAKIAEAEHRAIVAEAKAEAMQLGVLPQYADDAVTLVLAKATDNNSDIKTIVGELKTKYPVWFDANNGGSDDKKPTGQKGTGSSVNSTSQGNNSGDNKGIGARLAAQRRTGTNGNKKSFWS